MSISMSNVFTLIQTLLKDLHKKLKKKASRYLLGPCLMATRGPNKKRKGLGVSWYRDMSFRAMSR